MDELPGDPAAPITAAGGLTRLLDKGDHVIQRVGDKIHPIGKLLARFPITSRGILLAAVGLFLLLLLPPLVHFALRRLKRLEPNYRGKSIPQSFGVLIPLWSAPMLLLNAALYPERAPECKTWLIALIGFGLLGLLDDLLGDKTIKGLKGHLRAALKGRITTGFLKAVGGLALALLLARRIRPDHPLSTLLATLLIALSSNAINLLDLRPGRAAAVFLVTASATLLADIRKGVAGLPPILLIILPALPLYDRDARAAVMMGDAGSAPLGACLGLALATAPIPTIAKGIALLLLIALHILAERLSLTALIEKNPILRAADRLTGARPAPDLAKTQHLNT